MTSCIAYHFAYANKHMKKAPPSIIRQRYLTREFAAAGAFDIVETVEVVLTNRDRHFAGTAEFLGACRRAYERGWPLLLGDVEDMVKRTAPELMEDCVKLAYGSGAVIIDARSAGTFDLAALSSSIKILQREAVARRDNIRIGRRFSQAEPRPRADNQPKAARGTVVKANRQAAKLAPVVADIRAALPDGSRLTPTVLALALNERQIPTDRGNTWSAGTATRLLARIASMERVRATS